MNYGHPPMSIWVTVMLYFRPSKFVALVNPEIACLEIAYGAEFGRGTWAAIEPLLMIRPVRRKGEDEHVDLRHILIVMERKGYRYSASDSSPDIVLTPLGFLRFKDLERRLSAQERGDDVHAEDLRQLRKLYFIQLLLRTWNACILGSSGELRSYVFRS